MAVTDSVPFYHAFTCAQATAACRRLDNRNPDPKQQAMEEERRLRRNATSAQLKELHLARLALAKEQREKNAPAGPQLNMSDLPEATFGAPLIEKRLSAAHRSQFRPNNRIGGWAPVARKKQLRTWDECDESTDPASSYQWTLWDDPTFHFLYRGSTELWSCCNRTYSKDHMCESSGSVWQEDKPIPLEELLTHDRRVTSEAAEDAEWEKCEISSVGGSSWIEVQGALENDQTQDDVKSECSDMSFLLVDPAEEQPCEQPCEQAAVLTWAQRITNAATSQKDTLQRPSRPAVVQQKRAQKQKQKVKAVEEDDVDGFGMDDIGDVRRHPKGKRR